VYYGQMFPKQTGSQGSTIEYFTGLKKSDFISLNAQVKNILEILRIVFFVLIGFMVIRAFR